MIDKNARLRIPDGVEWTDTGGEIVLLDINRSLFFGLNEVSSHVWRCIAEGLSINATIQQMLQEYEIDEDTLQTDIAQLIDMLLDKKLVSA
jgi:hypothetical protein